MTADIARTLAIDGGSPVRTDPWPVDPSPLPADDPAPAEHLARELTAFLGASDHRIALFGSLTAAAPAALQTAAGDHAAGEVLLPALGAQAWVFAAAAAGYSPMPVEIDGETAAMAPRALSQALHASPAARAVVAVHPFGHPAALTELERLAHAASLPLIEDATSALGAAERGRPVGTVGAAGLLRLGVPEDDSAPCALLTPATVGAHAADPGGIDDDAARRALGWLRAEPEAQAARRRLAWELTFGVRGMRGVAGMSHGRYVRLAYHAYIARLRRIVWKRPLEDTLAALRAEGIPCEAAFTGPALHDEPTVREALGGSDPRLAADGFVVAERLPAEWIAIPLPATGTQREVDDVVAALRKLEAAGG